LFRWSTRINLTGHRTPEAIARRLILGSLALASVIPAFRSLVDLGSGAGFPGLPIALLHPDRTVSLVEARQRRHHFQRAAVRELAIENAVPLHGRAEQLEPRPHDVAVAQAVGPPERVVPWMLPWLRPSGFAVVPGAATLEAVERPSGILEASVVQYQLPLGGERCAAWIGRVQGEDGRGAASCGT
jgi:16S rRNA (guanine527-N7)-methyltransferase